MRTSIVTFAAAGICLLAFSFLGRGSPTGGPEPSPAASAESPPALPLEPEFTRHLEASTAPATPEQQAEGEKAAAELARAQTDALAQEERNLVEPERYAHPRRAAYQPPVTAPRNPAAFNDETQTTLDEEEQRKESAQF